MTPDERKLLEDLFSRLDRNQTAPRDPEADRFIAEQMASRPQAAYFLAQSVLVQEAALAEAEKRLREQGTSQASPSFLPTTSSGPWGPRPQEGERSGIRFGSQPASQPVATPQMAGQPAGMPGYAAASGGGSFLRNAAQTAVGVAGGMLAAEAISSMFGHSAYGAGAYGAGPTIIENETIIENNPPEHGQADDAAPAPENSSDADDRNDGPAQDADYDSGDSGYDDSGFDDGGFDDGGGYDV